MIVAELVTTDTCDRCGQTETARTPAGIQGGYGAVPLPGDWWRDGGRLLCWTCAEALGDVPEWAVSA